MNVIDKLKQFYMKSKKVNRPSPPKITFGQDDDPYYCDYNTRARKQINEAFDGQDDAYWNID